MLLLVFANVAGISGNAKAIEEICDFSNLFENTSIL